MKIPHVVIFNKIDISEANDDDINYCIKKEIKFVKISAKNNVGIKEAKQLIIDLAPVELKKEKVLAGDLINPGDVVLLVAPIDTAAPKGRLILPQVQVLREILDNDAIGMIVKEREIEESINRLKRNPDLVITDSQVVLKVDGDISPDVPLTTFSILFARYKGDLDTLVDGANRIDELKDGDKVLIAETCSHNVQCDDIGRVKIPRWLIQYTGKELDIDVCAGHDFPENLEDYSLIIHCGGCMINRMEMMRRINEADRRNTKITNYGVAISKLQGVLDRAIKPFYKTKNESLW